MTRQRPSAGAFTFAALSLCLVVACVISLSASPHPDGLEYVATSAGFLDSAQDNLVHAGSPFADYRFAGGDHWAAIAIAGSVGCALTFGLAWLLGNVTHPTR